MSPFELLKVVYYLCLLGHFPPAPLQQLLQGGTLEQFEVTGKEAMRVLVVRLLIASSSHSGLLLTVPVSLQNAGFLRIRRECFGRWICASGSTVRRFPYP